MSDPASIKVPELAEGTISFEQLDKDTRGRFVRNEVLVYSVLIIVAVTLVTVVIGLAAIILDQLHFNNQIYRDGYSQPVQVETRVVGQEGIFSNPSK